MTVNIDGKIGDLTQLSSYHYSEGQGEDDELPPTQHQNVPVRIFENKNFQNSIHH